MQTKKPPLSDAASAVAVLRTLKEAQRSLDGAGSPQGAAGPLSPEAEINDSAFVHPTAFVDAHARVGSETRIWHFSHVQSGAVIGAHCSLAQNVNIGNNVRIGDYCKIQNNVSIYEGVELEDYVFCGPSMVFTNVSNPRCEYPQKGTEHYLPTRVRYGATIGANATILCGNTIGRFAFVAVGAVVTKDVPEFALVKGSPARLAGWMSRDGKRLDFSSGSSCVVGDYEYRLDGEQVTCRDLRSPEQRVAAPS